MVQKILNVAEKNDAAKTLADILSAGLFQRREGLSKYNKIYDFRKIIGGKNVEMRMTSVSGHLLSLEFPQQYRKWYSCQPIQLFSLPVSKICSESMEPIKRTLEREAKWAESLIIWTDCDREGENIGYEIIDVCKAVKPSLIIKRARFSEMTKASIERAFSNLSEPNFAISKAVDVRQELDLRIGAAFTRFQTLRLSKKFPSLADQLISYGSCQFPTMGFVVERYKEIENFVAEQFWKIKVMHQIGDLKVDFHWKRVRLFHMTSAEVYHNIVTEKSLARVDKCLTKPKSKWRPLPLDTVELEKIGSKKLKMSAKRIMSIAEKLYTSGYISYPRTETNSFPKELNLIPLVSMQSSHSVWGDFASKLLNSPRSICARKGSKSDEAHPPIHPIKAASHLNGEEGILYEFIVRHFLAAVSEDAFGKETIVEIDINGEKFTGNGLIITERNYLDVYPYDKWSDKEIGDYSQIREFEPSSIELVSNFTEAPQLLSESDLIALMDKHGIGTDATHAEHIETIKNRQYVGVQDFKFVPGLLGIALCDGYDSMGFEMSKPHLRSELECDLKCISLGSKDPDSVLQEQLEKYKSVFVNAMEHVDKIDEACSKYLKESPGNNERIEVVPENSLYCHCQGTSATVVVSENGKRFFVCGADDAERRCDFFQWENETERALIPKCNCGLNSRPHTVSKEGRNKGKVFWSCPKIVGSPSRCSFFLWISETKVSSVYCNCGLEATRKSVTKAGANHNRLFWSCSKNNEKCSFFKWDEDSSQSQGNNIFDSTSSSSSSLVSTTTTTCHCGTAAALKTVQKEGSNKGRTFWSCSQTFDSSKRCNFFKWSEDESQKGSTVSQKSDSRTRVTSNGDSSRLLPPLVSQNNKRKRKCGLCQQEGHTRLKCPSK